ncbi:LacI family DNA-binding transcriptional regulator [Geminisphaera colitermitum]|uniref:LacI family DNA-binding transcriptional regulator n=1 Tax=Geminisphaera colitermitum TaxID=1148786 RepID=UPI0001965247|nr:LacI family DNA-binding transcriptional regulator [Geminisphaera colitermitum]
MPPIRPTQRDIARAAGVTQATVSLALGNHPRLSTEIRERIKTIAQQLGYCPDPYLAGLSAYKKQRRPRGYQATLAWISNFPPGRQHWRNISTFLHYYEGATARAAELGYQLEDHDLAAPGMTPARMEQILRTRNIPGILLAPQPEPLMRLDLNLDRFSSVTFGYSLVSPRLHMVTHHHFRSTETLLRKLRSLGYRRIGLALEAENELRIERIPSSAFLSEQRDWSHTERIPLLNEPRLTRERFLKWYSRYKPDVVVTLWDFAHIWLTDAGVRIPEDTGMALLSVRYRDGFYAGIWENPEEVGARAVELLIDLVHRGERGIPQLPSCLMLEGTWLDGKTIRPQ